MARAGAARSTGRTRGVVKLGTPLVCCSSWRRVTAPQAAGRFGRRAPIVSSSDSTPRSTSPRATAPLKALEVLAMRMNLLGVKRAPLFASATPAVRNVSFLPRRSSTETPGGPPRNSTSRSRERCRCFSLTCGFAASNRSAVAPRASGAESMSASASATVPAIIARGSPSITSSLFPSTPASRFAAVCTALAFDPSPIVSPRAPRADRPRPSASSPTPAGRRSPA